MDDDSLEGDPRDDAEYREWLRIRGIQPRDPHRGRVRVLGVYHIPYFPETYLLEVLIHRAPDEVDFSAWFPYTAPGRDEEWGVGLAHFYFDVEGRELVGSYLSRPSLEPRTRAGLILHGEAAEGVLIQDRMFRIRRIAPLPSRLLRLIWVEEGMPFAGPDQALGEDLWHS